MIHDARRENFRGGQMGERPKNLPDFKNPPLVEVALAVQFQRIEEFRIYDIGPLWDQFREEFGIAQEHPPLDPAFETFGTKPEPQGPKIELLSGPLPIPRLWFLNDAQTQLIQFQPDRFVLNWRKVKEGDSYPRYEQIKDRFVEELERLKRFLKDRGADRISPNQCEITYVNHIVVDNDEDLWAQPDKVFRFIGPEIKTETLGQPEDTHFQVRFRLLSDEDQPVGRLTAVAQPALSKEGGHMFMLTLMARGQPAKPTLEAASEFIDMGREKIVHSFAELTSETMHRRWGRSQ